MTDRELLELAAKAAGFTVKRIRETAVRSGAVLVDDAGELTHTFWNPLTDDGDRHRLLVGLRMTLAHEPSRGGWSVGAVVNGEFRWLAFDEDEAYATVRAAAAIAQEAPK